MRRFPGVMLWGLWFVLLPVRGEDHAVTSTSPVILGWVESVVLQPSGLQLEAKLDTGADSSSLDADRLSLFEREGQEWVSFGVDGSMHGHVVQQTIELPVSRWVRIRSAAGVDRRPVVRMPICLAEQAINAEFTLRDRREMTYPVLIGRKALTLLGLVDSSRTHLFSPCKEGASIEPMVTPSSDGKSTLDRPRDPDVQQTE